MVWQYLLTSSIDGKLPGWHPYTEKASAKLDHLSHTSHSENARNTTYTVKSGYFTYSVNLVALTQQNTSTGTIRQIRRYDPRKRQKLDNDFTQLFDGQYGHVWEDILTPVLQTLPGLETFLGVDRDSAIVPVRELTFQAIKPLPPQEWRAVIFGQSPYPRLESATGISMFDASFDDWQSPKFGSASSIRNIVKAAAMAKYGVNKMISVKELRERLVEWKTVTPPQWFQAMLSQGVLFLNAALTASIDKKITPGKHASFWLPVIQKIVEVILQSKVELSDGDGRKKTLFLWWGNEARKTKKRLDSLFKKYDHVEHLDWCNPAAQGDIFCDDPPHFKDVNDHIKTQRGSAIDWLPDETWLNGPGASSGVFGQFITNTQKLHALYLERLQVGLDPESLQPITGVSDQPLLTIIEACVPLGLDSQAEYALHAVKDKSDLELTNHEKGAVYLYTGCFLYGRLNKALRDPNRAKVKSYLSYLLLFLNAHDKLPKLKKGMVLYRGINKDFIKMYKQGSLITWWSVSSCSSKKSVAEGFSNGGTLFHVKAETAVPIMKLSAYQNEEEYVLAPGTQLKVTNVKKINGRSHIHLEEVVGKRLVN